MRTENLLELINVVRANCGSDWTTRSTNREATETVADLLSDEPSMQVDAFNGELDVYGSYIIAQIPAKETAAPVERVLVDMLSTEDDFSYGLMLIENTSPVKHEDWIMIISVGSFHRELV